ATVVRAVVLVGKCSALADFRLSLWVCALIAAHRSFSEFHRRLRPFHVLQHTTRLPGAISMLISISALSNVIDQRALTICA
ncbi:hypothetical protein, partial [Pandoraea communis]|uniref:hypothetical protein n=1 Tax=Pandoraea communis TaxID=2508297 RepID=UPI0025A622DB